ncbi:hypothetical protein [Roseobacter sp. TSBP12]|uniref:hypothetical protein n=1 Tax=Roseobacter sp. TSBP12 TaxID=1236613 RepID=UPI00125F533A|nr:hypothetical protein [Roseobacter sp. TSBP12]KAB6717736.1 hypothetical protein C8029_04240 [Roseobacter sp. TSBP12]
MSNHLTPLQVCERIIGSVEDLARICGQSAKAGYQWRRGSQWRDAGDFPATRHQRAILAHAARKGLPLEADWLIFGASEREVDLALAAHAARSTSGLSLADMAAADLQGMAAQ